MSPATPNTMLKIISSAIGHIRSLSEHSVCLLPPLKLSDCRVLLSRSERRAAKSTSL